MLMRRNAEGKEEQEGEAEEHRVVPCFRSARRVEQVSQLFATGKNMRKTEGSPRHTGARHTRGAQVVCLQFLNMFKKNSSRHLIWHVVHNAHQDSLH